MMILKIGSIDIPLLAALDIDQSYEPIGGETVVRTIGGTGICAGCGTGKSPGCGRFHSHTAATSKAKAKVSAIHRHMAIS